MAKPQFEVTREVRVPIKDGDGGIGEARLEHGRITATGEEAVRLSWWKRGSMFIPRPLILSEMELAHLLQEAKQQGLLRD